MGYLKSVVAILISVYATEAHADNCFTMVNSQVGKATSVLLTFSTVNRNGVASYADIPAGIVQHTTGSYYVRGEGHQIFSDRRTGGQRFAENKADKARVTFLVGPTHVGAVEVWYTPWNFAATFTPICENSILRGWAGGADGRDVHYMLRIRAGIVPPPPAR